MIDRKTIKAYALKNAIEHQGKAVVNIVLNGLFKEGLEKKDIKKIIPEIEEVLDEIQELSLEEQQVEFARLQDLVSHREIRVGLPELPNVKGEVVMRFAPFPSGPLHIGNLRTLLLNAGYVEKYGGRLLLIIDDTIGSEEKQIAHEAYKLIEDGINKLEVNYSKPVIRKSDRLEIYYDYAEKIIKKDKAYICSCNSEKLRENRKNGKECLCRKRSIEENLKLWKEMFEAKGGQYILRIKTSMKDKNPAFRDRVIFRISEREHPLTKKKYRVWPLLDFSWAVDDYLLKITHVIRGKELRIETDMENYIFNIFGWKKPEFLHMGLLRFEGIKLSKSKGQIEVKSGRYIGWDDPRTWSIDSLIKRGIQINVLKKFLLDLGVRENEITVPIDVLYSQNRTALHEIAKQSDFRKTTKEKSNVIILMPDGKKVYGFSEVKFKDGDVVRFPKFGYAKLNGIKENKFFFWFAHK